MYSADRARNSTARDGNEISTKPRVLRNTVGPPIRSRCLHSHNWTKCPNNITHRVMWVKRPWARTCCFCRSHDKRPDQDQGHSPSSSQSSSSAHVPTYGRYNRPRNNNNTWKMCRTWKTTDQIARLENARTNHLHAPMHFPALLFDPSFSKSCTFQSLVLFGPSFSDLINSAPPAHFPGSVFSVACPHFLFQQLRGVWSCPSYIRRSVYRGVACQPSS